MQGSCYISVYQLSISIQFNTLLVKIADERKVLSSVSNDNTLCMLCNFYC